ncbi:hypothetical protein N7536_006305 [Penicillium majusculum]|uniref:F-box domain-containing protein n=1 Tax=Penicillium solitum TaxID=60172 RepID=A0A1V6RNT3_9EURO|nr:uncharacterized protein PENSOL_c001G05120 [Penicillium solitum]KAJ5695893.1 hypothetical protein N7536_006305 [Penicillium majusculum]OQE03270.1 hypothetical protein PENSOL_c001G05120 [Penicillium solitum]
MPPHGTMTAAQRALGIAEIVGLILSFVPRDWFAPRKRDSLRHCALVNKLWLAETLPMIWYTFDLPLETLFKKLEPGRRQFYANFVVLAESHALHDSSSAKTLSRNLKNIVFPQMECLLLFTSGERGEFSLPRLKCPNLRCMTFQDVDIENEEKDDDMGPDAWESVFWDLSTNYPSLTELNFEFPPRVFPYAIRRLKKRHPNLRDCLKKLKFQEVTQFFHHDFSFADGVLAGDHDYFEP